MYNKLKIILFFASLLVFLSTTGIGKTIDLRFASHKHVEKMQVFYQNSNSIPDHNFFEIEGIALSSIRINEKNNPTFQNFKDKENFFASFLSSYSGIFSKSFYISYCLSRLNSSTFFPFYIAYHRLII